MRRKPDLVIVLTFGFFISLGISSCIDIDQELVTKEQAKASNFAVSLK